MDIQELGLQQKQGLEYSLKCFRKQLVLPQVEDSLRTAILSPSTDPVTGARFTPWPDWFEFILSSINPLERTENRYYNLIKRCVMLVLHTNFKNHPDIEVYSPFNNYPIFYKTDSLVHKYLSYDDSKLFAENLLINNAHMILEAVADRNRSHQFEDILKGGNLKKNWAFNNSLRIYYIRKWFNGTFPKSLTPLHCLLNTYFSEHRAFTSPLYDLYISGILHHEIWKKHNISQYNFSLAKNQLNEFLAETIDFKPLPALKTLGVRYILKNGADYERELILYNYKDQPWLLNI